jgi:hypothetical protein
VERVAVAGQRADLEAARADRIAKPGQRFVICEELGGLAVGVAGIVPGANLDVLQARVDGPIQNRLEWFIAEEDREDAEFHFAAGALSSGWR